MSRLILSLATFGTHGSNGVNHLSTWLNPILPSGVSDSCLPLGKTWESHVLELYQPEVVGLQGVFSASILRTQEIPGEEGIGNNLIGYEDDLVEGLLPPLLEAENHFKAQSTKSVTKYDNPYVVEIHRKYVSIKTTGIPAQKIKLNETETEGIQKLSLAFVQLLNSSKLSSQAAEVKEETPDWSDLNPVIILTNSGVSLEFLNTHKEDTNATEMSPEDRRLLWDFLTKYARNIFEEKLKELNVSEKYAEVFDHPTEQTGSFGFQNFVEFLWSVMRLSVDYAETAFQGWTTSQPDTTAPEVERKFLPTPVSLFAYEEPPLFHEFPSEEFLNRRRGIDSIFYGRGFI